MKKNSLLTIGLLFLAYCAIAQSIERQQIGAAGGSIEENSTSLNWTLGETFIAYDNTLIGFYKEGFLQPGSSNQNWDNLVNEYNNASYFQTNAEVFPNPFSSSFIFQVNEVLESDTQLSILDYSGKTLSRRTLPRGDLRMEWTMIDHPPGLYFLQLSDDSGVLTQSFKLLKM